MLSSLRITQLFAANSTIALGDGRVLGKSPSRVRGGGREQETLPGNDDYFTAYKLLY